MARKATTFSITSVRPSLSEDIENRTRRYVALMVIRTGCFAAMFFVPGLLFKSIFLALAVVLPVVAVLVANVGREKGAPPLHISPGPDDPRLLTSSHYTPGEGEYLR